MQPPHMPRTGIALSATALLFAAGCGVHTFWDTVTSRDLTWQEKLWARDEPLEVLKSSSDGAKKGKALATLRDPGNGENRELYLKLLTRVLTDPHEPMYREPLCRLGALRAIGSYKDKRAVDVLESVYLQPLPFTPDLNSVVRQQALASLEETGHEDARFALINAAKQPPSVGSLADRQQINDERLLAIRALANYKHWDSVEALIYVLEREKDVALRHRAQESLVTATGKQVAPDAKAWREAVENMPATAGREPSLIERVMWWNRPKTETPEP